MAASSSSVRVLQSTPEPILAQVRAAAEQAVRETQAAFLRGIEERMEGAHSGRVYGTHQASAPDEAPAKETGEYLAQTGKTEVGVHENMVEGFVYTDAPQAKRLELGDAARDKQPPVAARPMWHPLVDEQQPLHERRLQDALNQHLR